MEKNEPIRCPHCTRLVSPKVAVCPFCRKPVQAGVAQPAAGPRIGARTPIKCQSCHKPFSDLLKACPHCGAPNLAKAPTGETAAPAPASPKPAPSVVPPPTAAPTEAGAPRRLVLVEPASAPAESSRLKEKILYPAAVIAVICAVAAGYSWFAEGSPELWVVNTTGIDRLSIWVDGEEEIDAVPSTQLEDKAKARTARLSTGSHKLEAKGADGRLVDAASVTVERGAKGFLFAPARHPEVCFALETAGYGTWSGGGGSELLDTSSTFWTIDKHVDRWFEGSPDSLSVTKGTRGTFDRAVRMVSCEGR
ncbi:MAG: hypothetical protein HYZ28_27750 [Myxococcales bacterium]|nr:hypothetical protein [Myxococcales bacterium]